MDPTTTGVNRIARERVRQLQEEEYDLERDTRLHTSGQLALAAACYALPPKYRDVQIWDARLWVQLWPWPQRYWKPLTHVGSEADLASRIRELEKAGALVAAEIDRLVAEQRREQS